MARRKSTNSTGIPRLSGVPVHSAYTGYSCVKCGTWNYVQVEECLLAPENAYESEEWVCSNCNFIHAKTSDLPFLHWAPGTCTAESPSASNFWKNFFRVATDSAEAYYKQCNTCGRILPFREFSKHIGWGPLERQLECKACKGAINASLNPMRTPEQLHEAGSKRRVADLLLNGQNERIDFQSLFDRFGGCCFKTKMPLDINARSTWEIDHILPSLYLYPLTTQNAALLSANANNTKHAKWPSEYYTNSELIELARLTGANLRLLSSPTPVINPNIDVNACVARYLSVRENSNLGKRISELKDLLESYSLVDKLSQENKTLLGY